MFRRSCGEVGGGDQHRSSDVLRWCNIWGFKTASKTARALQAALSPVGCENRKGNETAVAGVLGEAMDTKHR